MTTERKITDARAAELAEMCEEATEPSGAGWVRYAAAARHALPLLLADRAADRAEIERLEKDLRTVQNAAVSLHKARDAELRHLKENATFDHRLRAQVESLQERDAQMTDALLAAERERDEARAEADRLQRLLKLRDRQMVQARQQWMRAAEKALAGDTRDLWLRVEMAKQPPVDVVLSDAAPPAPDADPAVLARHAAVQAGDLSGTVDLPDPRDQVCLCQSETYWDGAVCDDCPALAGRQRDPRDAVVAEIAAERRRQVEAEGWTPEHDDAHAAHELAIAAACYAAPGAAEGFPAGMRPRNKIMPFWPWSSSWWKPKDRRRDLIRAAALIIAEIERLDRLAALAALDGRQGGSNG